MKWDEEGWEAKPSRLTLLSYSAVAPSPFTLWATVTAVYFCKAEPQKLNLQPLSSLPHKKPHLRGQLAETHSDQGPLHMPVKAI